MKTLILGTALTSLFALNAAKAQTQQDKGTLNVVWNNCLPSMHNSLCGFGVEYAPKNAANLAFGVSALYNRGTVGFDIGSNAFDFRDKHFFAIRPSVGMVIANEGKENWLNTYGVETIQGFTLYSKDTPEQAGTVSTYRGRPIVNNGRQRLLGSVVLGTDIVFGRATGIFNGVVGARYEFGPNNSKMNLNLGLRINVNNTVKAVKKLKH
ncbi:MAG: hypothetical protein K8R48_00895 [Alphaproteobacteria bacterium]|nr:hypothetical protein [Alphaproteobacteria bacterium]